MTATFVFNPVTTRKLILLSPIFTFFTYFMLTYFHIFTYFLLSAIGLGWMFDITSLPVIGNMADALYDLWAENRLRLTGRGDLADILAERAEKLREAEPLEECDLDACNLDFGELE